jgi:hypothetical protein
VCTHEAATQIERTAADDPEGCRVAAGSTATLPKTARSKLAPCLRLPEPSREPERCTAAAEGMSGEGAAADRALRTHSDDPGSASVLPATGAGGACPRTPSPAKKPHGRPPLPGGFSGSWSGHGSPGLGSPGQGAPLAGRHVSRDASPGRPQSLNQRGFDLSRVCPSPVSVFLGSPIQEEWPFGEPGLFSASKLTDLCRAPSMST